MQTQILAEDSNAQPRDYSTTMLGAIVGKDSATFLQIGDGAIVIDDPQDEEEFCWVFWPEESEYANVTYFATAQDASEHIQIAVLDRAPMEVALFTDGLQRLALHIASKTAHSPFFRAMFKPIRQSKTGFSEADKLSVTRFLESPSVLERTNDDKSLVLATRRKEDD